jgi:hypothetical protein
MSPEEQNMKTGLDALGTAENKFGRAKHENGNRSPQYRRNRVRPRKKRKRDLMPSVSPKMSLVVQNMKSRPDALRTAENVPEITKYEHGT